MAERHQRGGQELPDEVQDRPEQNAGYDAVVKGAGQDSPFDAEVVMQVSDLMTRDPACCTPQTSIRDVAHLMMTHDCGEIPVVGANRRLVGVVTDRDIVCRAVAEGKGPQTTADVCMSSPVFTVTPETSLEECMALMEEHQIRRVPVVDEHQACCGIVSQADVAVRAPGRQTAELVKEVSRPA